MKTRFLGQKILELTGLVINDEGLVVRDGRLRVNVTGDGVVGKWLVWMPDQGSSSR